MASNLQKLIDLDLLSYFKSKLDLLFANKVDKVTGKGLSSNDYTSNEKTKLAGIASGAQVNVLEGIQKNGTTVTITNKIANISVPTKTSDITNDSGFLTTANVYTKTEIDSKLTGALHYKGTKATVAQLPSSGNQTGDMWHVTEDGGEYAWNGTAWEAMGSEIDLSGYVEDSDLGFATTTEIDALFTA